VSAQERGALPPLNVGVTRAPGGKVAATGHRLLHEIGDCILDLVLGDWDMRGTVA
jgi:hypothetical protein